MLQISVSAGDAGSVAKLSGESDVTVAGQLRDALDAQIYGGVRHLMVDLSDLRFADSASIRVLLEAHRTLQSKGGSLELAFPQPALAMSLSLLGVDKVLTVRTRGGAARRTDDASS